ncbi:hypothetical protein niasHT_024661 [Heterodera trifolii]|uniref:Uncharacterized protein n=1 Tax=Heterodera trifolii TaxID=157864 RepID=A0ABD2K7N2_9BILA
MNGAAPFPFGGGDKKSIMKGQSLEFPSTAPPKFVMQHVWDPNHNNRYSMGAVYDWLKRHTEERRRRRQQN